MTAPKVSVLIPTYNYAHLLPEAIDSVLQQTFTDYELIVVDDHSSDETDKVMLQYADNKRILYHRNEQNLGLVGNWNRCLQLARGRYIKFLMADDKFHPQLLQEMVAIMEQHPNVSLVTCFKAEFGNRNRRWAMPLQELQTGKKVMHHTLEHYGWLGEPTTVMFRRENLKAGSFNGAYTWLPDWEMWLRQLALGDCYIVPRVLAYIRNHANQVTKKVMDNYLNYFEEYHLYRAIRQKQEYDFDTSGLNMDQLVKRKAEKCALAMYKVLPRLHQKKGRLLFVKAFRIAYAESVLLRPLNRLLAGKQQRVPVLKEILTALLPLLPVWNTGISLLTEMA